MKLLAIRPDLVSKVWPFIAHWIDALNDKRESWWRMPDPKAACENRDAQLWLIWDSAAGRARGAVVTQITTDSARVAEVPLVAGDNMADWLHLLDDLEEWARAENCVAMIGYARSGWARMLKDKGWRERARLIERKL